VSVGYGSVPLEPADAAFEVPLFVVDGNDDIGLGNPLPMPNRGPGANHGSGGSPVPGCGLSLEACHGNTVDPKDLRWSGLAFKQAVNPGRLCRAERYLSMSVMMGAFLSFGVRGCRPQRLSTVCSRE
jgi:hypothetical protein